MVPTRSRCCSRYNLDVYVVYGAVGIFVLYLLFSVLSQRDSSIISQDELLTQLELYGITHTYIDEQNVPQLTVKFLHDGQGNTERVRKILEVKPQHFMGGTMLLWLT